MNVVLKIRVFLFCFFFSLLKLNGQNNNIDSILEISISQGIQGNFFVNYGREVIKDGRYIVPEINDLNELTFLQKNFIGTYASYRGSVRLGGRNYLELAYEKTRNKGVYDTTIETSSGTEIIIEDFELNHVNTFYTLRFKRGIGKKNKLFLTTGISYLALEQSVLNINPNADYVEIAERNVKNSYFEELTASFGIQYYFLKSGKFSLGIESRIYMIIGEDPEFETWSLSPVLKYSF